MATLHIPGEKKKKKVSLCNHVWKDYVGFTDAFTFCEYCDVKKEDWAKSPKTIGIDFAGPNREWRSEWIPLEMLRKKAGAESPNIFGIPPRMLDGGKIITGQEARAATYLAQDYCKPRVLPAIPDHVIENLRRYYRGK